MKFTEAMIAWNDKSDKIKVGPWPDCTGWSDDYATTVGACFTNLHKMTEEQRYTQLFIYFNAAVVEDGVDVQAAHREFLKIDEYQVLRSPGSWSMDPQFTASDL